METIRRQRHGEEQTFVTSGMDCIDFTHGGFAIGEMTVIGARPSVGKSTILRQAVRANCKKGDHCHLITPEMSADQVLRLFAALESGVPFRKIRYTRLEDSELAEVEAALKEVMRWPLTIDETSPITASEVISKARTVKRKKGTKLLGVDYLQKLKYGGKAAERHVYVTDAMVALSSLAKTEKIAVVAISSLTEPSAKDRNRPPTLLDFRQSGDIQYEANTAILLHREVDSENQRLVPECSLIFGKARSDQQGIKKIYFDGDRVMFIEQQEFLDRQRT
jgi:replicative DNA helicase